MPTVVPIKRGPFKAKKVSLVIPVFNEARNIENLFKVLAAIKWPLKIEYVFVDDCSTDGSAKILDSLASKNPAVRVFRKAVNEGKGSAVSFGIQQATGELIAIQDADLEYAPKDLLQLMDPIIKNYADVVFGSRFRRDANQVHRTYHRWVNALLTHLSNWASGISLTDMECCYKVFRADVLKRFHLRCNRFGFEPEVTAYVAKFPLRIQEFPVSYFPRNYMEGKKIGWKDGVAALWHIFQFNFLYSAEDCLLDPTQNEPTQDEPTLKKTANAP